jgi:sugar transferase (PEP-CTERM/EpsH1 system associated)
MGQYAEDNSAHHRLVCDFVDVDSVKWRQYADRRHGPMAWIYHRESARLLDYERKLAARSHAAVFVSEPEAALFRDLAPQQKDRVQVITNGLDHQFFKPDAAFANPFSTAGRAIVMTGAMDYWPNIDAALWFMTEILPPLRAEQPDLQFIVVGSNPTAELRRWNGRDNVTVTGRVDDVRPYLQHAALAVAPMRVARGIQNKVLEGMAMAKPVLSTTAGWEGIDAVPGQHLALADDTDGFVREARRLLADPAGSAALGAAARQRIVERYDWPVALQGFDRLLAF